MIRTALTIALCVVAGDAQAARCPDEAALRRIKTELWPRLYQTQDVAGLRALLHDDFRVVDARGRVDTKATELDWLAKNAWTARDFRYEITSLECAGDLAVIIGTGSTAAKTGRDTYVSSNYLIRTPAGWRIIGSHISGVRPATN